ncbi:MAG: TPM domain-containing protein [Flavobacteriales bacterium]|nr:TPM domain-containing protein [Flavobacteriales bacterium]
MKFPLGRNNNSGVAKWFAIAALLILSVNAFGIDPEYCKCYPPKPNGPIQDAQNILTAEEKRFLTEKLVKFTDETSNAIVIVTIDELCGGDAAKSAYEIGECWQVGQKEFDNGIVILIKPTGGPGDRKAFIATGYGLEGAIPDATAKLIVDQEMVPNFKGENWYAGLDKAIETISELARGEYNYKDYNKKAKDGGGGLLGLLPILFFIGIWFLLVFRRTSVYARNNDLGFWAALALMSASRGSHRGSCGGFSGFGGGSFGGGGAGGSW